MDLEKQKLLELVGEYRAAVKNAVNLLNVRFKKHQGFILERTGYLGSSKDATYSFHGIGCYIKTQEFEVDFDFGEGGRCDGIDAWFLWDFVKSNENVKGRYSSLSSFERIKCLLEKLTNDGLFTRDLTKYLGRPVELYDERLFYLVSAINDPDTPVWNAPDLSEEKNFVEGGL